MNDPNGLVYYNGKYHLFYQYNPLGNTADNIGWGHAVSTDLINWEQKPVAIPMQNGIMAYSGSAVVDWNNTSGFGINGKPPLVAIYTGSGTVQDQRIAYSNDEGLTWKNYSGNPVINSNNKQFRDPKVFWHKETQKWIMIVGLGYNSRVRFYSSTNLKNWTFMEDFGFVGNITGMWECPDLFKLNIDNDSTKSKWVLMHSIAGARLTQYFIGDFDGNHFTWENVNPTGILINDFENETYNGWTTIGTAFGSKPAPGNISGQKTVCGYLGNKLVNSFFNGNEAQGKLVSPEFTIQNNYINFLIGGGKQLNGVYIKLVVNGESVRKSTGENDEFLAWKHWDVSNYIGKPARIEIVDSSNVIWGHISVDHIIQSDVIVDKVNSGQLDHGMDFYASQTYSDIPASDGRRVLLAWLNNWNYSNYLPTHPWRGIMTIPRELKLETHNGQVKLVQRPVAELERLRKDDVRFTNKNLSTINDALNLVGNNNLLSNSSFKQFELKARIAVTDQKGFSLKFKKRGLQYTEYIFDFANKEIRFNRSRSGAMTSIGTFSYEQTAPLIIEDGYFDFDLFVDNCSAELFTANGQVVMSNQIFPDSTSNRIELTTAGDDIIFQKFEIWRLDKNVSRITPTLVNDPLFSFYPNPVINSNGTTIKIKDEKTGIVKFKLYDATGKVISEFQPSSNSIILPRNKFGNSIGTFFLSATDGTSTQTERLVVIGQ